MMWLVFFAVVTTLMIFDLGMFGTKNREMNFASSAKLSVFYIVSACIFGMWIAYSIGTQEAGEYFNGYLIEKALSLDNIFVISIIFKFFDIKSERQHRVLFWGILSVIVLRGAMIYSGAVLIEKFDWILYVFGTLLILTGVKILYTINSEFRPENNIVIKLAKKYLNISNDPSQKDRFWFRQNNKLYFTDLFLALLTIEAMDLLFALDSIPAIFAITDNIYIVYTSNIFAILGLRALYFCLSDLVERFKYLKYSLAIVLMFIGSKIFLVHFFGKIPTLLSLGITFAILLGGVLASLRAPKI
ncbi:MAG: TerC/Alx family metal homeostasis membrane protein [Pseudomonadota bacterium]